MDTQIHLSIPSSGLGDMGVKIGRDIEKLVTKPVKTAEVIKNTMMDPQDLRNFLYLVVGSGVQVNAGNSGMGKKINTTA